MTNDPYREPSGLGGPPPSDRDGTEPRPESAWMPPTDPPPSGEAHAAEESSPYQNPAAQTYPGGAFPPQGPVSQPYPTPAGLQPPGQPPAGPYQAPPPPGYPGPQRPTNGLAIAALVCSIAGVLTLISAPVGAVLGHIALRQVAQTGEEGAPLAKAAIWIGWIITGLVAIACCAVLAVAIAASRSGTEFGPR